MYLGVLRFHARKPALLLGVSEKCASKVSKSGLTPEEGRLFCANAVNIERTILMNEPTPRLATILADAGFTLVATPLTEFMKSGGSAKCLTLRIA